jgi:hypothetical protein
MRFFMVVKNVIGTFRLVCGCGLAPANMDQTCGRAQEDDSSSCSA